MPPKTSLIPLLRDSIRSGTLAALAMMPFGLLFKLLGLRVGHYGPKLAQWLFGQAGPMLLLAQHFVLGWLSALPLLWALRHVPAQRSRLAWGAAYGAAYYVALNSLALPLAFGDPTPWVLGWQVVAPSLVVHLVFGLCVAWTARPAAVRAAGRRGVQGAGA